MTYKNSWLILSQTHGGRSVKKTDTPGTRRRSHPAGRTHGQDPQRSWAMQIDVLSRESLPSLGLWATQPAPRRHPAAIINGLATVCQSEVCKTSNSHFEPKPWAMLRHSGIPAGMTGLWAKLGIVGIKMACRRCAVGCCLAGESGVRNDQDRGGEAAGVTPNRRCQDFLHAGSAGATGPYAPT